MEVIRPAGFNERRCISRDVLGFYGSIITCATYASKGSQTDQLPLNDILKALKACIVQHPVLQTVVKDAETESPQLARHLSMNLEDHLRILNPAEAGKHQAEWVQDLLKEAHNEKLPDLQTHPPWRVYILPLPSAGSTLSASAFLLAFSYSHALADGTSGLLFHRMFLYALLGVQGLPYNSDYQWDIPTSKEPLPPVERMVTLPVSWSFLLRPLLAEFLPSTLAHALGVSSNSAQDIWTGVGTRPQRPTPPQLLQTELRLKQVSSVTLQRTLAACRSHNVRLTGLLVVVISRALSETLRVRGQDFDKFMAQVVLDLRRCIPTSKDCMGNFPSAVSPLVTLPSSGQYSEPTTHLTDEDWDTIQHLTDRVTQASSSLADQPVALLKYLSNFRKWTIEQTEKPSDASFEVSNVGVFSSTSSQSDTQPKVQPNWHVFDMVFSQSASALGVPFNVNVASTETGPLNMVVSWWPGMLGIGDEGSFVEELCVRVVDQLDNV